MSIKSFHGAGFSWGILASSNSGYIGLMKYKDNGNGCTCITLTQGMLL